MELINNLQHEPRQYQHSYFRSTIILLLVLVMVRARVNTGRSGLRAHGCSSFPPCSAARTAPQSEVSYSRSKGRNRVVRAGPCPSQGSRAPPLLTPHVLMGETNHPLGIWAGGSALVVEDSEDQGSNTEGRKRQTLDALVSPCRPRERVQMSRSGGDIHLMNLSSLTEGHGLAFEATSR